LLHQLRMPNQESFLEYLEQMSRKQIRASN
jgi:hypothetical protein